MASSNNRLLYKAILVSVRIIPVLVSFIYVLNTALSYIGIDWAGFSYIVQLLFMGFIYLSSFAFRFCAYHRMFIYYIVIVFILNIIDYHWGIVLSDRDLLLMYVIITGLFLFIVLYLHQRNRKKKC